MSLKLYYGNCIFIFQSKIVKLNYCYIPQKDIFQNQSDLSSLIEVKKPLYYRKSLHSRISSQQPKQATVVPSTSQSRNFTHARIESSTLVSETTLHTAKNKRLTDENCSRAPHDISLSSSKSLENHTNKVSDVSRDQNDLNVPNKSKYRLLSKDITGNSVNIQKLNNSEHTENVWTKTFKPFNNSPSKRIPLKLKLQPKQKKRVKLPYEEDDFPLPTYERFLSGVDFNSINDQVSSSPNVKTDGHNTAYSLPISHFKPTINHDHSKQGCEKNKVSYPNYSGSSCSERITNPESALASAITIDAHLLSSFQPCSSMGTPGHSPRRKSINELKEKCNLLHQELEQYGDKHISSSYIPSKKECSDSVINITLNSVEEITLPQEINESDINAINVIGDSKDNNDTKTSMKDETDVSHIFDEPCGNSTTSSISKGSDNVTQQVVSHAHASNTTTCNDITISIDENVLHQQSIVLEDKDIEKNVIDLTGNSDELCPENGVSENMYSNCEENISVEVNKSMFMDEESEIFQIKIM